MRASFRAVVVLGLFALSAPVALPALQPEELRVAQFPPLKAHLVYLLSYEGGVMNRYYVVDGDAGEVLGILPGGYNSAFRIAPDGSRYYSSDTFYEKAVRGTRLDQITSFDTRTGQVADEIPIPPKRLLSYTINSSFDLTEDGRYLLQYNMAPAGSVTVVDMRTKKVLAEVPAAGCGLVFPYAPDAFAMLCANGSMLRLRFDENGKVERQQTQPFFDVNNDPLMQNGLAYPHLDLGLFVSYEGIVHELDLAGPETYQTPAWSLRRPGEEAWWPSGWLPLAYSPAKNRLYVIMHEGKKWEHTSGGHEIWAYDLKTRERVFRRHFDEPIWAIGVSQDDDPQLYALTNENETILYVCDAETGGIVREVEELGSFPFTMVTLPAPAP